MAKHKVELDGNQAKVTFGVGNDGLLCKVSVATRKLVDTRKPAEKKQAAREKAAKLAKAFLEDVQA